MAADRNNLTNERSLLKRCILPVSCHLDALRNERAKYEGYAARQRRYDPEIAETEALLAELERAAVEPPALQCDAAEEYVIKAFLALGHRATDAQVAEVAAKVRAASPVNREGDI